jgi:hypothetical protein
MDEMMESLSILSGGKIIEGEWYELSAEDDGSEGDEAIVRAARVGLTMADEQLIQLRPGSLNFD